MSIPRVRRVRILASLSCLFSIPPSGLSLPWFPSTSWSMPIPALVTSSQHSLHLLHHNCLPTLFSKRIHIPPFSARVDPGDWSGGSNKQSEVLSSDNSCQLGEVWLGQLPDMSVHCILTVHCTLFIADMNVHCTLHRAPEWCSELWFSHLSLHQKDNPMPLNVHQGSVRSRSPPPSLCSNMAFPRSPTQLTSLTLFEIITHTPGPLFLLVFLQCFANKLHDLLILFEYCLCSPS